MSEENSPTHEDREHLIASDGGGPEGLLDNPDRREFLKRAALGGGAALQSVEIEEHDAHRFAAFDFKMRNRLQLCCLIRRPRWS